MTLPASGNSISLNQVNVELGNTGTDAINMGSSDVRGLFGVSSGAIDMSDGYGKTFVTFFGSRGVFAGGEGTNVISYITIASAGNAADFGDLTSARGHCDGLSNGSRGVFGGGGAGGPGVNVIEYITIASTGNATDFGNLTVGRQEPGTASDGSRGVWAGGRVGGTFHNVMDYITIASTGNANDFGNLSGTRGSMAGTSNGPRGVFAGSSYNNIVNVIDYITIGSTGNATDFGNLTQATMDLSAASNVTRGVFAGGSTADSSSGDTNVISYITIASAGNATDFGDLTVSRQALGGTSDGSRGVFGGGYHSGGTDANVIDYITISTAGNATDFGDITVAGNATGKNAGVGATSGT